MSVPGSREPLFFFFFRVSLWDPQSQGCPASPALLQHWEQSFPSPPGSAVPSSLLSLTPQLLFSFCSVKQRCLNEQKRRRQRATKKISIFIGSFVICFGPYIITRSVFPAGVDEGTAWGTKVTSDEQVLVWWGWEGLQLIWDWQNLLETWGHQNTHTCTSWHTFTCCCP